MQPFGRYNLLEFIASGGMADVYRAESPGEAGFVKEVAIKVIRGDFRDHTEFLEMFKQEARLSSKLTHANIVQVFDFGQVDGRYYIAMEFVHGRALDRLARHCHSLPGTLDLPKIVHIGAQVATALGFAHRMHDNDQPMGIVHRDISPQNVLISYEGEVKLSDFGIARVINTVGLTRPGTVKGKPSYMAPEQARGEEVDGRADIFSLGIVMWELCCGFNLFKRDSEPASLLAIVGPNPEIQPPSKWNALVPPDLDDAIMSALERDPAKRTASVQDFASQLQHVLFKLAKGPNDIDLRSLMRRLWPDGAKPPGEPKKVTLELPASEPPADDKPGPTGPNASNGAGAPPRHSGNIATAPPSTAMFQNAAPPALAGRTLPFVVAPPSTELIEISAHTELQAPMSHHGVTVLATQPQTSTDSPSFSSAQKRRFVAITPVVAVAIVAVALIGAIVAFYGIPFWRAKPVSLRLVEVIEEPVKAAPVMLRPAMAEPAVLPINANAGAPAPATPVQGLEQRAQAAPSGVAPMDTAPPSVASTPTSGSSSRPSSPAVAAKRTPSVAETKPIKKEAHPKPDEAAPRQATLEIFSTSWATISVDGKHYGTTPLTLSLPPGQHRLRAEHEGLAPVEYTVTLESGETSRWSPQLKAATP